MNRLFQRKHRSPNRCWRTTCPLGSWVYCLGWPEGRLQPSSRSAANRNRVIRSIGKLDFESLTTSMKVPMNSANTSLQSDFRKLTSLSSESLLTVNNFILSVYISNLDELYSWYLSRFFSKILSTEHYYWLLFINDLLAKN